MAIKGLKPLEAPELLKWMAHDDWPGLYILGSFNRHITVHSQQCRAVNLIQALMKEVVIEGKGVAIVGAGFAGLTAAAFALEKTTALVTLFDAAPRPLWLQDACSNRWLHPGIYDWPRPGSLEPKTNLPVLNWRSGTARDVARQVRAEWDRIAATKAALTVRLETKITSVERDAGKLVLVLHDGSKEGFDVVVLAVGFGVEEGGQNHIGYWNDADGLDGVANDAKVLISGFGDGGLADVLRLCLPDIRQANLVELVRSVPDSVCQELLDQENALQKDVAALHEFYQDLKPVDDIVKRLKSSAAPRARVRLTGKTDYVYGTGSAILNRFLVAHLRHVRNREEFDIRVPVTTELKDQNGKTRVKFKNGEEEEFDHVVFRWGPKAPFDRIGSVGDWKMAHTWRLHWRALPQSMDETRVLADGSGPDGVPSALVSKLLASESSSRKWCLILRPDDQASDEWEVHMRLAMAACGDMTALNIEPIEVKVGEVFSGMLPICSLVRALCAADIVLADLTGYDPTILMLLGVRAAVRRSITIPCTLDESIDKIWKELPFNLRELNVVFGSEKDRGAILNKTVAAALTQSRALPRYLDLPVYDYVRQDTFDESAGEAQPILLLRAFQNYEGGGRLNTVETGIRKAFDLGGDARVESVIDQQSPRLAGQRLYEAIRHWRRCVVDVTWWRPNVMFELGVRLATHPEGTFCLLDETVAAAGPVGSVKLKEFLGLKGYNLRAYGFEHKFTSEAARVGEIYETAAQHFQTTQDGYDHLPDVDLVAEAEATQRKNAQQQVDIAPLYGSKSTAFGNQILSSALEKRCAAWCYLVERQRPHMLRPIDLLDERSADSFRRFRRLSSRLQLELARGTRDDHMRQRIAEAEKNAKDSDASAMADLLEIWRRIRTSPPWMVDPSKVQSEDWQDWQEDADQLKTLEARLEKLNNPACQLVLQGVRSDRTRVERTVERLKGSTK
jgi:hypothetical protein